MCDRLEFHFLELGKTDLSKPPELLASAERAAVYLKYASDEDKIDYIQQILDEEDLDMSENLYRKVTAEEIEYEKQESRYRFMLDMNTMKSVADREGFERGEKLGLERGEKLGLERGRNEGEKLGLERGEKLGLERGAANKQREIARNLKLLGIAEDNIRKATGLSLEEIKSIQ